MTFVETFLRRSSVTRANVFKFKRKKKSKFTTLRFMFSVIMVMRSNKSLRLNFISQSYREYMQILYI